LELACSKGLWYGTLVYFLGSLASVFTACYSVKLIILTFFYQPRMSYKVFSGVHESSLLMTIPVFFLYFCSIFFGYLFKDLFIGLGTDFWVGPAIINPIVNASIESEFLSSFYKIMPVSVSLFAAVLIYFAYSDSYYTRQPLYSYDSFWFFIFVFLTKRWYFDSLINLLSIRFLNFFNEIMVHSFDRGLIEVFGTRGVIYFCWFVSKRFIAQMHSGFVFIYVYLHFLSSIFLIIILVYLSHSIFYPLFDTDIVIMLVVSLFFDIYSDKNRSGSKHFSASTT